MPFSLESRTPHIVVCGAGVIGAAIAYYLSERGARVTIVEEGEVAGAASGKAGGFLASDWCDGTPLAQLAKTSFSMHKRLARSFGTRYDFRCLRTYWVDSRSSGDFPTAHAGETGWLSHPFRVHRLLGDEHTTAQLHPRKFTQMLIDAASKNGAHLIHGRVETVKPTRGVVDRVRVNATELPCDVIVIAMGPWSSSASLGVSIPEVYGLKGHSVTLTTGSELPAQALFLEDMMLGGTRSAPELLTRPNGTIYLSGISEQLTVPPTAGKVTPGKTRQSYSVILLSRFHPP